MGKGLDQPVVCLERRVAHAARDFGMDPARSVRFHDPASSCTRWSTTAGGGPVAVQLDPRRGVRHVLATDYPTLHASGHLDAARWSDDDQFERGLDAVLRMPFSSS
ncbi:MAG TPA: hypothetical protein VK659_09525 [Asanoa sp.]|nr:hypothetical protein [Asanoa sp.]